MTLFICRVYDVKILSRVLQNFVGTTAPIRSNSSASDTSLCWWRKLLRHDQISLVSVALLAYVASSVEGRVKLSFFFLFLLSQGLFVWEKGCSHRLIHTKGKRTQLCHHLKPRQDCYSEAFSCFSVPDDWFMYLRGGWSLQQNRFPSRFSLILNIPSYFMLLHKVLYRRGIPYVWFYLRCLIPFVCLWLGSE